MQITGHLIYFLIYSILLALALNIIIGWNNKYSILQLIETKSSKWKLFAAGVLHIRILISVTIYGHVRLGTERAWFYYQPCTKFIIHEVYYWKRTNSKMADYQVNHSFIIGIFVSRVYTYYLRDFHYWNTLSVNYVSTIYTLSFFFPGANIEWTFATSYNSFWSRVFILWQISCCL